MDEQDRNKSATFTSIQLENLSWIEAEDMLKNYEVVLLALGARTKEHGPHLPLNNDFLMAEYLKEKVIKKVPVAVLPTLQYGYYPSFLEYPGSVSLKEETFKQVVIDICKSMNGYGIKKFYIINTGFSTLKPLKSAAVELEHLGIILRFLNLLEVEKKHDPELLQQEGGTHADEGETSIMLHMYPEVVDMNKVVKDYDSRPDRRGLTRDPSGDGVYSPTGIWGDPTLATEEKGKILTDALVEEIINQVTNLIDL
ncbi:MAG: creatininase family protein [Candidatus Heimdallarchaeaceae archaeon]